MKVFPWVVKTLTCFWRRFESSSMNFRPAVEDSFPVPSERADPETAISPLVPTRLFSAFSAPPRSLSLLSRPSHERGLEDLECQTRSEERRVGKECGSRWWMCQ